MAQKKLAFFAREVPPERRSKRTIYKMVPIDPKDPKSRYELQKTEGVQGNVREYDVRLPKGNSVRMTEEQMAHAGLDPNNPHRVAEVQELMDTREDNEMMLAD